MSARKKQKIKQSMEALYGRDIEEDRFINYHVLSLFVSGSRAMWLP